MFLNVLLEQDPHCSSSLFTPRASSTSRQQVQCAEKAEWRHGINCTLQVSSHLKCCQSTGSFQHRVVPRSCCPPQGFWNGQITLGHQREVANS